MKTNETSVILKLRGLTRPEALDLNNEIAKHDPQEATATLQSGEHGVLDPITVTLVLGVLAIRALAMWLMKTKTKTIIRQEMEIIHPGGRVERRTFEYDTSHENAEKDIVKELTKALAVDTTGGSNDTTTT